MRTIRKMSEKQKIQMHPRVRPTLENYLRGVFHPKGLRQFMEGVNYDLNLGPIQSKIQLGIATAVDVLKYPFYISVGYTLLK